MYHNNRPIQTANSCHNQIHTDYSQILQFMRGLRVGGHPFDMGLALVTAHPGIWDEGAPYKITKSDLAYLPFEKPIGTTSKRAAELLSGQWTVDYFGSPETYSFKNQEVKWSNKQGRSGSGFWAERNNQIAISWRNSGSVETWPLSGTSISTTLNFGFRGKASKL